MSFQFLAKVASGHPRAERWPRRLTFGFCVIAIVLGALKSWTSRFAMNTDGVQYLDNAAAYWSGDFAHALNSQWSPLYPWLIGALSAVVHPGPYLEFPLVHVLNFLIYALSIAAFLFFLRGVLAMFPQSRRAPAIRASTMLIAYSSFLYCSLDLSSLAYVTPDLLVGLFVFLAAGLLLLSAAGTATTVQYLALGAALGLGYLAKTPFFLFGLLCLVMVAVLARKQPAGRIRFWLAVVVFASITAPYVWILSNAKGRFTFGDSGRWNVIWMVNRVPLYNWQGGPPENGNPIHPTRQLSTDPAIFEFATPVVGTYPPWYDPIYWSEGAKIAFRPADFVHALLKQLQFYGYVTHRGQLPLVFALATFLLFARNRPSILTAILPFWPILFLGATPFVLYAMVHAEGRYLAPFFVLLCTIVAAALLIAADESLNARVTISIAAVAAALMLVETVIAPPPEPPTRLHYEVAQGVQSLGLKKGDPVAIVSGDLDYFWARLAGARVTMQIDFGRAACPDCRSRQNEWAKAKQILSSQNVVMVVSPCVPGVVDQPGWQQLAASGVYAYRLR